MRQTGTAVAGGGHKWPAQRGDAAGTEGSDVRVRTQRTDGRTQRSDGRTQGRTHTHTHTLPRSGG